MEFWFHGAGQPDDKLAAEAASLGVILPDNLTKPQKYGVWEENWPAVDLFLRCQTQWRAGPGGLIGLDYSVVLSLATLYLPASAEKQTILEEVQIMERRALELFDEAAKRERS